MTVRHFLDLSDAGSAAIAAMLNDALEPQEGARRAAQGHGRRRRAARRPHAGDDLREELDPHARLVRHGDAPARRHHDRDGRGHRRSSAAARPSPIPRACSRAMVDAIMIRTDDHAKIVEMARHATVPVINGLTDAQPPLPDHGRPADRDRAARLARGLAGGRGSATATTCSHSIVEAAALMGFDVVAACPEGYEPDADVIGSRDRQGGKRPHRARSARRRSRARTSSSPTPGSRWVRAMPRRSSPRWRPIR